MKALPPWLHDVPLPEPPHSRREAPQQEAPSHQPPLAAAPPERTEADIEVPDWLQETEPLSPAFSAGDMPDWLQSPTPAGEASPESGEVPDWLQAAGATPAESSEVPDWLQPSTPAAGEASPESGEVPDWLQATATTPTESSDMPDWLKSPDPATAGAGDMPDWLQSSPPPAAIDDDTVPDWLEGGDEMLTHANQQEETLPDWLQGGEDMLTPSTTEQKEETLPDWLQGGATPFIPSVREDTVPTWLQGSQASDTPQEETVPDWLQETETETPPPADEDIFAPPSTPPQRESAPSHMQSPSGATDWLRSLGVDEQDSEPLQLPPTQSESESQSKAAADELDDDQSLSWLRDVSSQDLQQDLQRDLEEIDPFEFEAPTSSAETPPEAGTQFPGWLAAGATAAAATTADDDFPDWMRSEKEHTAPPEPAPAAPPSGASDETTLPWLAEETPTTPAPTPDTPATSDEDIPAWLRAETEAAPTASDEDIPDWLRTGTSELAPLPPPPDAPPAPTPATSDEDIPAWLRAETEAAPTASDEDIPDWLRTGTSELAPLPPPPDAPPAPAPATSDEDIPAWLKAGDAEPAAPPADDIPDWLRTGTSELAPPPSQTDAPPAPAPAAADEDIPAWLKAGDAEPAAPPADDIPDWLRTGTSELAPPPSQTDAPPAPAPDSDSDIPAWLKAGDAEPTSPPPASDMPAWLQSSIEETPAQTPPGTGELPAPEAPPAQPADSDIPPWLVSDTPTEQPPAGQPAEDLPPWLSSEGDAPVAPTSEDEGALPAWLRGAEHDMPASAPAPSQPAPPPPAATEGRFSLFDEAELQPEPTAPTQASAGDSGAGFLGGTDLPAWLRAPETKPEPEAAEESPDAGMTNWLQRLGALDEGDESDPGLAAAAPAISLPRPTYSRSKEQLEAIALLQTLVARPFPEHATEPAPAKPSLWKRIGIERMLYVLLALALLAGTLMPSLTEQLQLQPTPTTTSNITALATTIDTLDEEDVVLLAYEWDAQRKSELDLLEEAVTNHLMNRQSKLILVSTDPQGTLLSFELREPLREQGYEGKGTDYVLLGYRPGGELALRAMAQDFRGTLQSDFQGDDASEGEVANRIIGEPPDLTIEPRIEHINDLAMIIVMADHPQDVQGWMEQIYRVMPASEKVPMVQLLPAEVAPQVQPYLRSENVFYLAGKQDALAYAAFTGGEATSQADIAQTQGQLYFAVIAFVLLVILGSIIGMVTKE